ncbi:hypothetical protein L596_016496 [Steinernema carpocapsae]|uniref:Uncharacterized protein n=1 Tax=Steinernema carpocapsae TaxID=34508 RepID=A0A4U5NJ44_STECR|nr:hypothetical protein L596_016496 [Steinernema carpocapsae]
MGICLIICIFEPLGLYHVIFKSALMETTAQVETFVALGSKGRLTSTPIKTSQPEFRILFSSLVRLLLPASNDNPISPRRGVSSLLSKEDGFEFCFLLVFPTFQQLGLLLLNT